MRPWSHPLPLALALATMLGATEAARSEPAAAPSQDGSPPGRLLRAAQIERFTLQNGLAVVLLEDHRVPRIALNLGFRVGSRDELPGQRGTAHLFEHLMFSGTARVPRGQFDAIMEAEGGENNASTSEDLTLYHEEGPSHLLETFLWLEADRLGSLGATLSRRTLAREVAIVDNERRERFDNRPYGRAELELPGLLWPPGHPYHHPTIGVPADLRSTTPDRLREFFAARYCLSNAALVVVGDFVPARARALIEGTLGLLPAHAAPPRPSPRPVALAAPAVRTVRDRVPLERTTMAWHGPPVLSAGHADADVLAALLGQGKAARLYRSLVRSRTMAESVEVRYEPLQAGGQLVVEATAQGEHSAAALEEVIAGELHRLLTDGVDPSELERARALVTADRLSALDSLSDLAETLQTLELLGGDARRLYDLWLAPVDRVTAQTVLALARSLFGAPAVIVRTVPR